MRSHSGTLAMTLVACLVAITPSHSAAAAFSFTAFDVPGARSSLAHSINDAGWIVGQFTDRGGRLRGFVRTPT
ncbi:MAG TPA: hypothetical protein VNA31_08555, partial [bacterium]|nr:hypothetical protein [bacterium]